MEKVTDNALRVLAAAGLHGIGAVCRVWEPTVQALGALQGGRRQHACGRARSYVAEPPPPAPCLPPPTPSSSIACRRSDGAAQATHAACGESACWPAICWPPCAGAFHSATHSHQARDLLQHGTPSQPPSRSAPRPLQPLLCPEIHGDSGLDGPLGGPVLPPSTQQPVPGKAPNVMFERISAHFRAT